MSGTRPEDSPLGDAELITAARAGDAEAFGQLYERHAGATWAVARQYTNSAADAEDVVAETFTKVFAILKEGGGPDVAFRAYVFTAARRLGMQRVQAGRRTEATDDIRVLEAALDTEESTEAPTMADFERGVVAQAYSTLPERWQAVLWYTEVESLSPAKIGPLLGLSANGVAALAYRAREGLRQAYLQQHLQEPLASGCREVAGKLGAYVRGGLAARDTTQVDGHLEGCGDCRALLLELGDVNHGMRAVIAPLVLGALGLGVLAHPLPVSGGLAAGVAALAGGGGAAAAAGTTATATTATGSAATGTAATGSAATGTAATGTAATGAGAVGGAGASGAAAGGAAAGAVAGGAAAAGGVAGIGAALASLPLAVIGLAAATVVVAAAVATAGALGVFSQDPDASASDAVVTSAPEPTTTGTATARPVSPTDLPSSSASPDAPTADASPESTAPGPDARRPSVATVAVGGTAEPGPDGDAGPTAEPGSGAAPPPATDPDPDVPPAPSPEPGPSPAPGQPTEPPVSPTPSPAPAQISVPAASGPVVLVADGAEQGLSINIENSGGAIATGLRAEITLPPGAVLASTTTQIVASPLRMALASPSAAGARLAVGGASGWVCAGTAGSGAATCALDRLEPGTTAVLTLQVVVDESALGDAEAVVSIQVTGDGLAPLRLQAPVLVHRQARLDVAAASSVDLVEGQRQQVRVTVANGGDVPVRGAAVRVAPPTGVEWAASPGASGPGWSCETEPSGTVLCVRDLAAGAVAPLMLHVRAATGVVPGPIGAFHVTASAPGARAGQLDLGVAARASRLAFTSAPVARLVDGGAGRVEVTVANSGNHPAQGVVAEVVLPRHLVADLTPDRGGASCAVADGAAVRCDLGTVAPGEAASVVVGVRAVAAGSGDVAVRLTGGTGAEVVERAAAATGWGGFAPRFSQAGGWSVTQVGAPLLSCLGVPGTGLAVSGTCQNAVAGAGSALDNNDFLMVPLNAAGGRHVSSSARLAVPADREIAFAGLYWSANHGRFDQLTGDPATVRLRGPGEPAYRDLTGEVIAEVQDDARRAYYQSFVDVTEQVRAGGPGVWSVADIAVASTRFDLTPTYYAGWALVVVYAEPGAGAVAVYDGGAWAGSSGPSAPAFAFAADGSRAQIGVVGWEGDRSSSGDSLLLDGSALTPWRWTGSALAATGSPTNAFDSTAVGWRAANSLGVDAKHFQEAPLRAPVSTLTAVATGDRYLLGVITVQTRD